MISEMLDIKTALLIFGFVFLLLVVTRKVIRKDKARSPNQVKSSRAADPAARHRMTETQFNKSWKSLSYLMLAAAAGNLYMLYNAVSDALETGSYIYWMDAAFSLAAAGIAVLIWRLHRQSLVIAYFVVTILPIMFFVSTGHSMDGIIRLFPLVLVYFAVKPVWEYMDEQHQASA